MDARQKYEMHKSSVVRRALHQIALHKEATIKDLKRRGLDDVVLSIEADNTLLRELTELAEKRESEIALLRERLDLFERRERERAA